MDDMKEREKEELEISYPAIRELDHKTVHPGIDDEWSLYHVNYATGENTYLQNEIK
jgi:hypothetical protein